MSKRQVQINAELARCALASDVLAIVRRSVAEFNVVNCGTALSRIARAPDGRRLVAREESDPDVVSLLATAAGLVRRHARHVESRQLASLLHACGKLGVGVDAAEALVSAVERATETHASKFNPQELANALWGCAKLGVRVDSALVRLLGDAAAASLERGASRSGSEKKTRDWRVDWTAQGVSNAVWAFATLGASARDDNGEFACVFHHLHASIERKASAGEFNAQETANALWAIARLAAPDSTDSAEAEADSAEAESSSSGRHIESEALRSARAAASALASSTTGSWFERQKRGGGLESQHVANIAWACGKLGLAGDARVAAAVASAAAAAAPGANAQELSMIAWAMAEFPPALVADAGAESLGRDETPLRAVAASFASRAAEGVASPQQLATTARAFAKLGKLDLGLMDAIAEAILALPGALEDRVLPQDVANLLWAFAKLGLGETETHVRAFAALARAARARLRAARRARASSDDDANPKRAPSARAAYSSRQLVMVAWAHGALGAADAKTLDALASAVRSALPECNARDLSDAAWAFAALGVTAAQKPRLVARMGRAARRNLETFNAQELLKFLGAFERLGGSDAKLAEAVAKKRSTRYCFPALARAAPRGTGGNGGNGAREAPASPTGAFCSIALASATPQRFEGTSKERSRVDDSCGGYGRGNTGVALWEGAFVLAEWLSRQTDPGRSKDVSAAVGEAWGGDRGWTGKTGVELGAGLGLPSIVASKLGVEMIATDGASRFPAKPPEEKSKKKTWPVFPFSVFRVAARRGEPPSLIPPQDLSMSSEFQEGRTRYLESFADSTRLRAMSDHLIVAFRHARESSASRRRGVFPVSPFARLRSPPEPSGNALRSLSQAIETSWNSSPRTCARTLRARACAAWCGEATTRSKRWACRASPTWCSPPTWCTGTTPRSGVCSSRPCATCAARTHF